MKLFSAKSAENISKNSCPFVAEKIKTMIIKQPDKVISDDKFSKAGYEAEKQMAFYLHRAFADEEHIAVLNGIRLQKGNDVCQIDHLIIHEYGMVIVESKSVTSKVKIN